MPQSLEPGMPDYPRSLLTRLRDKRAQTCVSLVKLEHEIGTPASANSRTSRTGRASRASRPSRRGKARAASQRKKPDACAWQKAAVAPKVSINPGRSLSSPLMRNPESRAHVLLCHSHPSMTELGSCSTLRSAVCTTGALSNDTSTSTMLRGPPRMFVEEERGVTHSATIQSAARRRRTVPDPDTALPDETPDGAASAAV